MEDIEKIIQSSTLVVGTKQVIRGLNERKLKYVIIAADADNMIKSKLTSQAGKAGAEILMYPLMDKLGLLSGINVAAAVIGIVK